MGIEAQFEGQEQGRHEEDNMKTIVPIKCKNAVLKLKLSVDGKLLMTLHDNHSILFWDSDTFDLIKKIHFKENIRDFALSPDNQYIITLTALDYRDKSSAINSTIHLHDMSTNQFLDSKTIGDCRCVAFIDNQMIAVGTLKRGTKEKVDWVDFYTIKGLQKVDTFLFPEYELVFELFVVPNQNIIVSLGIGLLIFDFVDKKLLNHIHCDNLQTDWDIWETSSLTVNRIASLIGLGFSAFDSRAGAGKRVCVFDLESREIRGWYVEEIKDPNNLAISDDGRYLATTMYDSNTILITNLQTGLLAEEIQVKDVSAIAFLPQSHKLIVGSKSRQPLAIIE